MPPSQMQKLKSREAEQHVNRVQELLWLEQEQLEATKETLQTAPRSKLGNHISEAPSPRHAMRFNSA